MATKSTAQAHWEGTLLEGAGNVDLVTSGLGHFDLKWADRAEAASGGTNPEELIAAAHAACFSMSLSLALAKNGTPAETIDTKAVVGFQPGQGLTGSDISVVAKVPGLNSDEFQKFVGEAETGCPVSRALTGIPITVTSEFIS
jgi:lipoyl-dependent peroxiredoxin